MNWLNTIAILLVAFLPVFLESYFRGLRNLVGAQIDLLPALMVYAGLNAGISTVALLATLGGLWFDSLSANPLGITVLPSGLAESESNQSPPSVASSATVEIPAFKPA